MLTIPRRIRYASRHSFPRPMHILEEKEGDQLIFSVRGHLDTLGTPAFEERVLERVEAGARAVILDCSELDYVNSAGLKSFLVITRRLEMLGGRFTICSLSPHIAAVFATIGFDQIMTVTPTRQDALKLQDGEARPA